MKQLTEAQKQCLESRNPVKPPCKGCTERKLQCHCAGNCNRWDEYQTKVEAYRKELQLKNEVVQYIYDNNARVMKRQGWTKRRLKNYGD